MFPVYKPEWFGIKELVPRESYKYIQESVLWGVFDSRILITADRLRNVYGKMIANTWPWNGTHEYRGWRPNSCSVGSILSQHRFGRAIDLVPVDYTAEEIRQEILLTQNTDLDIFEYVTAMELGTNWLHIDCRSHNKKANGILTFKP